MDEVRMAREVRRGRRAILTGFALVMVLLLALVGLLLRATVFLDPNPALEPAGLAQVFSDPAAEIYVRGAEGKTVCLSGGPELASLLAPENWQESSRREAQAGAPVFSLRLAELYEVHIYANGSIQVYDGYAGRFQVGRMVYQGQVDSQALSAQIEAAEAARGGASLFLFD